jgi:hypothetical protein
MTFNGLKIWARIINLPFGYMHKKWGEVIAGSLGDTSILHHNFVI